MPSTWTYDMFKQGKDKIMAQTGTTDCPPPMTSPNTYNEFDTNGMSESDLAGVFIVNSGGAASRNHPPSMSDACAFMQKANPKRTTPWPMYQYDADFKTSSLKIIGYLPCNSQAPHNATVII